MIYYKQTPEKSKVMIIRTIQLHFSFEDYWGFEAKIVILSEVF